MTDCSQSLELDIAAFLTDPRAPQFDAFRAHYPRCAACAAEVRAWTELHAALGHERHPAPQLLAAYAELGGPERAGVDRHLAGCPACREELRVLDAFDPAQLTRPAPLRARRGSGWLDGLARLVWHPAFAYGLAILLVVPLLWRTQGPGQALDLPLSPRVARPAQDGAGELAARPPQPVALERSSAVLRKRALDRAAVPEARVPSAPVAGSAGRAQGPAEAEALAALRDEARPALAEDVGLAAAEEAGLAPAAEAGLGRGDAALEQLDPVALATAPERVSLRVPVEPGPRRQVSVLLRSGSGAALLERSAEAAAGRAEVAVDVLRSSLAAGRYRVEVRDGAGPARVFELPVVAR